MKYILLLFSLSLSQWASSQKLTPFFVNYPHTPNGFSFDLIESIVSEPNGILWIGTQDGLYRFDGYRYERFGFSPEDSSSISDNLITKLYYEDGLLYISTATRGISILNIRTGKTQRVKLFGEQRGMRYSALSISPYTSDSLWVSCSNEPLLKMHKKNFGITPLPLSSLVKENNSHPPFFYHIASAIHDTGKIWALRMDAILLIDKKKGTYTPFTFDIILDNERKTAKGYNQLIIENDSIAWVTVARVGLFRWNYKANQYEHYRASSAEAAARSYLYTSLIEKDKHNFWLASSGKELLEFDKQTKTFSLIEHRSGDPNSLPRGTIRTLHKTKQGAILVGASPNGIAYSQPLGQSFKNISLPNFFEKSSYKNLYSLNDSLLLANDANGKLALYNTHRNTWERITYSSIAQRKIQPWLNVLPVNNDQSWLLKSENSSRYKFTIAGKKMQLLHEKLFDSENDSTLWAWVDIDEDIYYVNEDGLFCWNKTTNATTSYLPENFPSEKPFPVFTKALLDSKGVLWLPTLTGLYRFDTRSKKFDFLNARKELLYAGLVNITDIQIDQNERIYAGTYNNGIFVLSAKENAAIIDHWSANNLLPADKIINLSIDKTGDHLWCIMQNSVVRINTKNKSTQIWDKQNSPLASSFIPNGATIHHPSATWYKLDTALHLYSFAHTDTIALRPFITQLKANSETFYSVSNNIYFEKNSSSATLHISTGFYSDPSHLSLYYRLHKDQDWLFVNNGEIQLTNLKQGESTLYLKAHVNGIMTGSGYSTYTLFRSYYFYQSWWFKLLAAAAMIALLLLVYKRRVHKIKKNLEEKNALAVQLTKLETTALRSQMNPHFLFNTLNTLRYLVMTGENKKATDYIIKLSRLLRMILHHSSAEKIALQEELEMVELYLEIERLRFENNFQYSIDVDKDISLYAIKIPPMLLQPFAENALKHGLANSELTKKILEIRVEALQEDSIKIQIKDNGIGRSRAAELKADHPFISVGSSITSQRIEIFNKTNSSQITLSISDATESSQNPGTLVEIIVKSL